MYLLMRYADGSTVEAVLLAKGRDRLRMVVAGLPDAVELKRAGSRWLTPDRQAVDFDFMMEDGREAAVSTVGHRVRTAAG